MLPSQEVAPDTDKPLLMIADLSNVWVVVDLHEADAMHVSMGSLATVTTPALPGQTFTGKVEMVSSVVDPERHTIPIRVQLANPDGRLKPSMFAQVRFQVQHAASALEVAATALVSDGERQHVFVEGNRGRFSRRQVTAGSAHDGRVAVFSGLRVGDVVVEEGSILLENQLAIGQ